MYVKKAEKKTDDLLKDLFPDPVISHVKRSTNPSEFDDSAPLVSWVGELPS